MKKEVLLLLSLVFLISCVALVGPYKSKKVKDEFQAVGNYSFDKVDVFISSTSISKRYNFKTKEDITKEYSRAIKEKLTESRRLSSQSPFELIVKVVFTRKVFLLNMKKIKYLDYKYTIRLQKEGRYKGSIVKEGKLINDHKYASKESSQEDSQLALLTPAGDTVWIESKELAKAQKNKLYRLQESQMFDDILQKILGSLEKFK